MIELNTDVEFKRVERWDEDMRHFVNALMLNTYTWKECSEIIVKKGLLISEWEKFDKRSNRTKVTLHIPSTRDFRVALIDKGVGREWLEEPMVIDDVVVMDVLNRARVLDKYPSLYVDWADKLYYDSVDRF